MIVSPTDVQRIRTIVLITWAVFAFWMILFPQSVLGLLTRKRITFATPVAWAYRVLGLVNLLGALDLLFRSLT